MLVFLVNQILTEATANKSFFTSTHLPFHSLTIFFLFYFVVLELVSCSRSFLRLCPQSSVTGSTFPPLFSPLPWLPASPMLCATCVLLSLLPTVYTNPHPLSLLCQFTSFQSSQKVCACQWFLPWFWLLPVPVFWPIDNGPENCQNWAAWQTFN